jgi:hypothetical protein
MATSKGSTAPGPAIDPILVIQVLQQNLQSTDARLQRVEVGKIFIENQAKMDEN